VIRDDLKKKPARIPESLWNLLRSSSPIRTAEEELIAIFNSAPACSAPNSSFAITVQRILKSCMALYDSTKHIEVSFVDAPDTSIDTFFDLEHQVLKVHHRWLDFDVMHHKYPCRDHLPDNMAGPNAPFYCDHIIEELLRKALPTIFRLAPMTRAAENGVIRQIRQRLRHMPHSITLERIAQINGLTITWEDNEIGSFRKAYRSRVGYHVVLHEERCASTRLELLHGDARKSPSDQNTSIGTLPNGQQLNASSPVTYTEGYAPCGCPEQLTTSQCNKGVVFTDLDCSKNYFPMIALNQQSAFFGAPPEPTDFGGRVEVRDLLDRISQAGYVQTLPVWAQPCPQSPGASAVQPQPQLSRMQQTQQDLFIRHSKRQKKGCE
jgi:hypothetical protein